MMMPGPAAHLPKEILESYEVLDHRHASSILAGEFPLQLAEMCEALSSFRFRKSEIVIGGGNESKIPKNFSTLMRPSGWEEKKLQADMTIDGTTVRSESHKIDYVKGRVALDLEWNSKDQTFDRDLLAFRAFFEYDRISVGVLVTRGPRLHLLFKTLGIQSKYGASTTHWGKLTPRLESGRGGGCPILALGITEKLFLPDE